MFGAVVAGVLGKNKKITAENAEAQRKEVAGPGSWGVERAADGRG